MKKKVIEKEKNMIIFFFALNYCHVEEVVLFIENLTLNSRGKKEAKKSFL